MEVITFTGFVPPPRFDDLPWTEVQIEEAPATSGPWTLIDTLALDPVDSDPENPLTRSFTTELGTAENLWYRISFADASGDTTLPSNPLLNSIAATTGLQSGPCSAWTTVDDILGCCDVESTTTVIETAADLASELLYRLSGQQFAGVCEATVRPCTSRGTCWPPWMDAWPVASCSCTRLSTIRLAGYPVRAITEVRIDDEVLDTTEYRLDRNRELVRLADADGNPQTWPACQRLDLESGEGTFFVSYTYGQEPPGTAVAAATELACQIALTACLGSSGDTGECELPAGVVRVSRQGITVDTQSLGLWLLGSLRTGMPMVDAFLSSYGRPRQRRTVIAVPEADPWPLRVS